MWGTPPHACRPANCQPDLMLLGKSEVCNHFNFIPLLLSSKKLFLAIGKKKSYTISHTLAFQSHMFQENHLLFLISFQTTWLQTWPSYIFWKLCPWESNFHLKKRDMYFQNDGTGLRITVKLPLFCFMVIHVLHIFIQFSNLAINSWKKYFLCQNQKRFLLLTSNLHAQFWELYQGSLMHMQVLPLPKIT